MEARVLLDPGATHSFISPVFACKIDWQPTRMIKPLAVTTPLSDEIKTNNMFPSCPVCVEDRNLCADLVVLDVLEFDVILGMDWLSKYYVTLDCREKIATFRIPGFEEFHFRGDKGEPPSTLISAIVARKLLRKGCQGFLAMV